MRRPLPQPTEQALRRTALTLSAHIEQLGGLLLVSSGLPKLYVLGSPNALYVTRYDSTRKEQLGLPSVEHAPLGAVYAGIDGNETDPSTLTAAANGDILTHPEAARFVTIIVAAAEHGQISVNPALRYLQHR